MTGPKAAGGKTAGMIAVAWWAVGLTTAPYILQKGQRAHLISQKALSNVKSATTFFSRLSSLPSREVGPS